MGRVLLRDAWEFLQRGTLSGLAADLRYEAPLTRPGAFLHSRRRIATET